jgi:predicted nucleotidyltransferase
MVDHEILNTVKQYVMLIPKEIGVKEAYLFGSFARGKEREGSDIDIAVIVENMPDFFSTQRLLMQLRRNIDLRIEPHPIMEQDFNSSNPFAWEIEKTGIKVYPAS